MEGGSDGPGGLAHLSVNDQPSVGRTGQAGDALQLLNEFFVQLVAAGGVNNNQIR